MPKELERSEPSPRWRMTPDEMRRFQEHLERWRRKHPNTTLSSWMREAIELKMRVDQESDQAVLKIAKRLSK